MNKDNLHISDEQLAAGILEQDPEGDSTVIVRQADGTFLDVRTGKQARTWKELAY